MASRMDRHSSHSASGMEGHSSSMEMHSSTEVHSNMEMHGSIEKHSKVVGSRAGGCSKSLIEVGCVDVKKRFKRSELLYMVLSFHLRVYCVCKFTHNFNTLCRSVTTFSPCLI